MRESSARIRRVWQKETPWVMRLSSDWTSTTYSLSFYRTGRIILTISQSQSFIQESGFLIYPQLDGEEKDQRNHLRQVIYRFKHDVDNINRISFIWIQNVCTLPDLPFKHITKSMPSYWNVLNNGERSKTAIRCFFHSNVSRVNQFFTFIFLDNLQQRFWTIWNSNDETW